MSSYLIDQIRQLSNVTVRPNTEVIRAGAQPCTDWLPRSLGRDDSGFLLTGPDLAPTGGLPVGWPLVQSAHRHLAQLAVPRQSAYSR
jgi:hypothetical protein